MCKLVILTAGDLCKFGLPTWFEGGGFWKQQIDMILTRLSGDDVGKSQQYCEKDITMCKIDNSNEPWQWPSCKTWLKKEVYIPD